MTEDLPELPSDAIHVDLKQVVEALVFASQKPISAKEILAVLRGASAASKEDAALERLAKSTEDDVINAIDALAADYIDAGRSFEIRENAAGWQVVTSAAFGPWLRQLFPESKPARLSAPALETLAIIAYRQPATRSELEAVRGVAVDGVMQTLLDRQLIRIAGRADVPGRPLLYETTSYFMEHFGLRNLDELPNATELRRAAIALAQQAAESSSGESTPLPAENAPAENAPAENAPAENAPAENAPAENAVPAEAETPAECSEAAPADAQPTEPTPPEPNTKTTDQNPETESTDPADTAEAADAKPQPEA